MVFQGPYALLGIKQGSAICKIGAGTFVLFLWPLAEKIIKWSPQFPVVCFPIRLEIVA